MDTLLIGFGNPLRRDDGVGFVAAQELQDQGYRAVALTQPLPELALELTEAKEVIFLDADASIPPGVIRLCEVKPASTTQSSHTLTPQGILALAAFIDAHQPKVRVLSLGVEDLNFGEGFSPRVQAAFLEYLHQARLLMEEACTS